MRFEMFAALTLTSMLGPPPPATQPCTPDVIIVNAKVHTVDRAHPTAEAIAVCGDVISRGDRANAIVLDVFEKLARERGARNRRPRIEHAQVVRDADKKRFQPAGGWFPEERITMAEAIEYYTLGSAYAEFAEARKGTLAEGKLADLVILSRDLFTITPREILDTKPVLTMVGGRIMYERPPTGSGR